MLYCTKCILLCSTSVLTINGYFHTVTMYNIDILFDVDMFTEIAIHRLLMFCINIGVINVTK